MALRAPSGLICPTKSEAERHQTRVCAAAGGRDHSWSRSGSRETGVRSLGAGAAGSLVSLGVRTSATASAWTGRSRPRQCPRVTAKRHLQLEKERTPPHGGGLGHSHPGLGVVGRGRGSMEPRRAAGPGPAGELWARAARPGSTRSSGAGAPAGQPPQSSCFSGRRGRRGHGGGLREAGRTSTFYPEWHLPGAGPGIRVVMSLDSYPLRPSHSGPASAIGVRAPDQHPLSMSTDRQTRAERDATVWPWPGSRGETQSASAAPAQHRCPWGARHGEWGPLPTRGRPHCGHKSRGGQQTEGGPPGPAPAQRCSPDSGPGSLLWLGQR